MGQRVAACLWLTAALLAAAGCDAPAAAPARAGTVVSLSPAATDLLLAMNLGDRLTAVSAYDHDPRVRGKLPVAGDYQKIDWERLANLRPNFLIVQGRADRLPPGLRERAAELGCTVVNIQIDRLDDIYTAIDQLGVTMSAQDAAVAAAKKLRDQIASAPASGKTALLVIGDDGMNVVGRNNYLDDLLTAAGGKNVIDADGYVKFDREKARTLSPDVVFLLLPGARDAVVDKATANVVNHLPAGKPSRRVIAITDADALLPASNVGRLAFRFADVFRDVKRK